MIKNKIVAFAMGAVCALSAVAFAACSSGNDSTISSSENVSNSSSAIANFKTAEFDGKINSLLGEDTDLISFSISVVSSYIGELTEAEDINAMLDLLNGVPLTASVESAAIAKSAAKQTTLWIYIYCGGNCSCVIWVAEDGTVYASTDGEDYVSPIGAVDYAAIKEYLQMAESKFFSAIL